jgi:hypothetical protein
MFYTSRVGILLWVLQNRHFFLNLEICMVYYVAEDLPIRSSKTKKHRNILRPDSMFIMKDASLKFLVSRKKYSFLFFFKKIFSPHPGTSIPCLPGGKSRVLSGAACAPPVRQSLCTPPRLWIAGYPGR